MAYSFVNPYNFIPLEQNEPKRNDDGRGNYSGVIHYSILTRTPLFIPNTSSDDAFKLRSGELKDKEAMLEHKSLDFFSYTDLSENRESTENKPAVPVIPGSEMRGLMRSSFEILTNSCMSAAEDDEDNVILSKRTQETFRPGLLRKEAKDSFMLFGATDYLVRTIAENDLTDDLSWADDDEHNSRRCYVQNQVTEGQKVTFELDSQEKIDRKEYKPIARNVDPDCGNGENKISGYFIKGEDGPENITKTGKIQKQRKHCGHIFVLDRKSVGRKVDLKQLETVLDLYVQNGKSLYKEYRDKLGDFIDKAAAGTFFPVYYSSAVKGYTMLSPACITREVYRNTIRKMLRGHASCSDKKNLCPACRLFGTVVDSKKNKTAFSVSSRVRFSDLRLNTPFDPKAVYLPVTTLKELSSPKLQNLEFYVKRPTGAQFWTYDYYFLYAAGIKGMKEYLPEINGRKFYWHQNIGNRIPPENTEPKPSPDMDDSTLDKYKRNMTIRPVRKGVKFTGEVYFEDLTKKELNELIYVLDCGDEDADLPDKKHGYKLGSGKPYGLGSIATKVDEVNIVLFKADHDKRMISRQTSDYAPDYSQLGFDQDTLNCFEKMTDFAVVKRKNVSYPYLQKPGPGKEVFVYEWFTDNHGKYDKKEKSILKNKMANSRSEMVYVQYLKPMEPFTQSILKSQETPSEAASEGKKADYSSGKTEEKKGDRSSGDGNMASRKKGAVWIGAEELSGDMKKKLAALHGSKLGCAFIKAAGKLNQQLLQSASKEYAILLISDRLNLEKDFLLMDFAGKKFDKIYQTISKKEGKIFRDYDWKVLK